MNQAGIPHVHELAEAWRQEAAMIRLCNADERLAALCEAHARDLEASLQNAENALLSPAEAAADPEILWDSPDHIAPRGAGGTGQELQQTGPAESASGRSAKTRRAENGNFRTESGNYAVG